MPPFRTLKLRHLALLFLAAVAMMTVARLAFVVTFDSLHRLGTAEGLRGLYLGLKFDLRWAAILVMPPWLLALPGEPTPRRRWLGALLLAAALVAYLGVLWAGMPDDRAGRKWLGAFLLLAAASRWGGGGYGLRSGREARILWAGYALVVTAFTLAAYASDFGSYSYNRVRLNGTVLGFLQNPLISAQMVWQSYPVLRGAILLALPLVALTFALRRMEGWDALPLPALPRRTSHVALTVLLLGLMWGKWSRYPLRWGEAFDGRRSFAAQMALNPALSILETRFIREPGVDLPQVKATHAVLADYFGTRPTFAPDGSPSLVRIQEPRPLVTGTPHVVFIQLESLAAFKTSMGGNALDPTPFLKDLAARSLYFDRFHVVMENTSRSMFATLFGIPDVGPVEINATRNPLLVDQDCVINALEDYDKHYFLGGSANWAQIRAAMKNNIRGLQLHEEGAFKAAPVDVWGLSDADLLLEGQAMVRGSGKPTWSFYQTSGNHPPYTIPKQFTDFQVVKHAPEVLSQAGFVGNDEFNAVRLMDYSVMRFFREAEKDPAHLNTVYVLWADHGMPRGSRDARFGAVPLSIQHIPLIIHAPGFIKAGRVVSTVGSQMDIIPTVMSLLGRRVRLQTLGKDLLDPAFADKAAAFTFSTWQRPATIGLIQGGHYLIHTPEGKTSLFDLGAPTEVDQGDQHPERRARMLALARGFQAWSLYLMTRNKPQEAHP